MKHPTTETIEVRLTYRAIERNKAYLNLIGIRKATAWYKDHLQLNNPPVRGKAPRKLPTFVLLTEDAANRQKAEKEGLVSLSGTRLRVNYDVSLCLKALLQSGSMSKE
jgi:hypothetical protein